MNRFIASIVGIAAVGAFAGCGGVSEVTKERVARSETAVQQAQQTVGNSEAGAVELQQAKEIAAAARAQLDKKNAKEAERLAHKAQLTAELAVAKSQTSQARRAADELLASLETLRQEAARGQTTNR